MEIIDLSQEIFAGMPVYGDLPDVSIEVYATHEGWEGLEGASTASPSVLKMSLSEHTGTHVDALNHMGRAYWAQSIDTMPLSMFYTEGVCIDLSHKGLKELIEPHELERACQASNIVLKPGDTVLIYTDHYRKYYGTKDWPNGPGLSVESAYWLGRTGIAAFGVETMSPGIPNQSNKKVHMICGEMGFTHYENLVNLNALVDRGRFRFIALPLKIKGGTGSPVRAIAVFDNGV